MIKVPQNPSFFLQKERSKEKATFKNESTEEGKTFLKVEQNLTGEEEGNIICPGIFERIEKDRRRLVAFLGQSYST